jgi:O-acetylhomoserine (thiol)-lyase
MSGPRFPAFATGALHAGAGPDPATGAHAPALQVSAGFVFHSTDQAAGLYNLERSGYTSAQLSNPTSALLEERIATLEGGVAGIATATGQAALHVALTTVAGAGGHIVASAALGPGAHALLMHVLPRFGITTTLVDPDQPDLWRAAIRPHTRLLYGEALSDPGLRVLNIPALAALAHEHHLPLLVDASLATPWLLRPFEHGADLLLHDASAFLCGSGTALGGLLVEGGTFDWQAAWQHTARYAELCAPWDGFNGLVCGDESTVAPFALRARHEGLHAFGAALSPHNADTILHGIDTLALRMERHVCNARHVAGFLAAHPAVEAVHHPDLASHQDHALARALWLNGGGAVLTCRLKGGPAAGRRLIEQLRLFAHVTHTGGSRSLVCHPASTTHHRMTAAQRAAAGVGDDTIRLAVGLEQIDDLTDDLSRALKLATRGA